jgi:thiol-disulfide isomerase/thioredoxin
MLKKTLLLFSLFFLLAFKLISHQEITDIINLKQESNPNLHLDFTFFNREIRPINWAPKFRERIEKTYKGIPISDSLSFYLKSENPSQYKYDLYKSGEFDKLDFLKFISKYNIDTTALSKKPLKQGYVAVVGFYQNKQFIIADVNRNENFGDDIKYEFDINFRKGKLGNEEAILSTLPSSKYSYETLYNGNIHTYTRELIFYPAMFESNEQDDKKEVEYLSKFRYRDYWKGEKLIDNKIYEFYYQAVDNNFGAIFIKPKNILFKKNDDVFNNQFRHFSNDTMIIGNAHYKIDSINRSISKLYLKQISKNEGAFGKSIGGILKNYKLEDLKGKSFRINDISHQKKYTLIEFWGTWCGPCLRLTPELKKIAVSKSSKLNIISIAVDDNSKKVEQYVKNKKMNWTNAFIDINSNSHIRKELQIEEFPTIILIDSNNKILYQGGSNSLESISKLIK